MPGSGWLRAPGTAPWRRGLARGQRFVDLCWLPRPNGDGDSRAVPLRRAPAFTPKAVPAEGYPPKQEWEAGIAEVGWARDALDDAGRREQRLVVVADGHDATAPVWKALPAGAALLALFALPDPPVPVQRGRKRLCGEQAPRPAEWLGEADGWQQTEFAVRGRTVRPTSRVEGPYRLKRAAAHPVFLLVVRGVDRRGQRVRREPTSWLVSAQAAADGGWALPYQAPELLAWAWQRWEGDVAAASRRRRSGWAIRRAGGPARRWRAPASAPAARWWRGSGRWSPAQLWADLWAELWDLGEFRPVWGRTPLNWPEMADWAAAQTNALLTANHT